MRTFGCALMHYYVFTFSVLIAEVDCGCNLMIGVDYPEAPWRRGPYGCLQEGLCQEGRVLTDVIISSRSRYPT
jgi:hypothetical protein